MSVLSIVVPVYNEEATIQPLLETVLAAALPDGVDREVIVVNDGSADGTADALKAFDGNPMIRVFHQPANRGKGAALRRGFADVDQGVFGRAGVPPASGHHLRSPAGVVRSHG